ncbi:MAG: hypothetical protein AAB870_00415 [Patescibacteria group bacterium]
MTTKIAIISSITWNAIVKVAEGEVVTEYSLRWDDKTNTPHQGEIGGYRLQSFLGTLHRNDHLYFFNEVGEHPFPNVYEHLRFEKTKKDALNGFLAVYDPVLSTDTKQLAVKVTEKKLKDLQIYEYIKSRVLSTEMPKELVVPSELPSGKVGELITMMVEKWRPNTFK